MMPPCEPAGPTHARLITRWCPASEVSGPQAHTLLPVALLPFVHGAGEVLSVASQYHGNIAPIAHSAASACIAWAHTRCGHGLEVCMLGRWLVTLCMV